MEGVESPKGLLAAGFCNAFNDLGKSLEVSCFAKLFFLILIQGKDISIEALRFEIVQELDE